MTLLLQFLNITIFYLRFNSVWKFVIIKYKLVSNRLQSLTASDNKA